MRKILVLFSAFLIGGFGADAATPRTSPRAGTVASQSTAQKTATASRPTNNARTARTPVAAQTSSQTTSTGTRNVTTITSGSSAGRSAVTSRAAKQSVVSTGTKIAAAAQNTVVDEQCWNGFMGCMDSFCMLDNMNGGRCLCSDKNAEYDSILAEIQSLDEQSYQMATVGVEQIEMGAGANAVIAKTQEITKKLEQEAENKKRNALDLALWNVSDDTFDSDAMDIFALSSDDTSVMNKTGDALYRAAAKLCNTQMPECASQSKMMEMMYQQRIRSDCTAYENSLRQNRTQSAQKLAAAQSAMREAALEQYRNANKYDLGQCSVQFKQCMQTTGGCGDDFSGCVGLIQEATTKSMKSGANSQFSFNNIKTKKIKSNSSSITIAQSTYDILESKKPLCMTVTQQCVNVADQVWDTFIREVAPQVKSAELMAESDLRTSCISNIASCFQKGCKDRMDPNDPDGSYDMCLTNPDTLKDTCKIEVAPCEAAIPNIMDYVTARLASMRVDSCTREFKECLTSEDRCGDDYTQCIGLDTDTIVEMCPADKLPGCKYATTDNPDKDVYNNLTEIATGIFLNIDNNMLSACQKAVQSKVLEVCGDLSTCEAFTDDDSIGTDSLVSYKDSDGNTVIDGLMNFGLLEMNTDGTDIIKKNYTAIYDEFGNLKAAEVNANPTLQRIASNINIVVNKAKQKITEIANDETVGMCITGRSKTWSGDTGTHTARFPNLLNSYKLMIFNAALDKAYSNYRAKYDTMVAEALENQSDDVKSMLCTAIAYNPDSARCTSYDTNDGEPVCSAYTISGALENMFDDTETEENSNNQGQEGLSSDGLRYIVKGANIANRLKNMSYGKGEFVEKDKYGNIIGKVSISSIYSASTNICTITTTTTRCANIQPEKDDNPDSAAFCDFWLLGWCVSKPEQEEKKFYCSEYSEPTVTVQEIKM